MAPLGNKRTRPALPVNPDVKAATRLALENAAIWAESVALDSDLFGAVKQRQTTQERAALLEARMCAVNYMRLGARQ
jgi:hypothetical protein